MKALLIAALFMSSNVLFGQDFKLVKNEKLSLTGYNDGLRTIWFSADNSLLMGDNGDLLKWHIQEDRLIQKVGIPGYTVYPSCLSADQSIWVQANGNYNNPDKKDITDMHANLNVFTYANDKMSPYKLDAYINDLEFIPGRDYQMLVIKTDPKTYFYSLKIFSLSTLKDVLTIKTCETNKDIMVCLDVSEDGKYGAVGYAGNNSRVEIYDLVNLKILKTFDFSSEITKVEIASGQVVASGSKKLHHIELESLTLKKTIDTEAGTFALALSPNGKTAAVGDRNGGADLIDLESGEVNHFYTGQCQSLAFDNKGNMLAVGVFKTLHTPEIPSAFIYFNENKNETVVSTNTTPEVVQATEWQSYTNDKLGFSALFPSTPKVDESVDSKGKKKLKVSCTNKVNGAVLKVSDASQIKSSKYDKTTESVADKFIEKMGETAIVTSQDKLKEYGAAVHERVFVKKGLTYHYRTFIKDGKLYSLIFFTTEKESTEHETFFEGFKF